MCWRVMWRPGPEWVAKLTCLLRLRRIVGWALAQQRSYGGAKAQPTIPIRCFLFLLCLLSLPLFATPSQPRYESLLKELRCLVCQNQDLLESHAALASDLKQQVAKLMTEGKTDEEIRRYLVQRYGEFILFKPLIKPTTWVLWFGPGAFLLLGLSGLSIWVIRSR